MPQPLPRVRYNLDFMPSPVPDRPGLLIRDPFRYSDAVLIIPPILVEAVQCFDGNHTDLDLREALVRITGDLQVGDLEQHLIATLRSAGFLEDDAYAQMRQARHGEFAAAETRLPAHAGSGYPLEPENLRATFDRYLDGRAAPHADGRVLGIAAPHVSPEGGWECYRDAYAAMPRDAAGRTFVILGTSHYGAPDRFGLTRKAFVTPFGDAPTDTALVDRLTEEAADAIEMEDYCHAVEHSIEFQVVFLQHLYGPTVRILPILCGSYGRSILAGGKPEESEEVRRFLGALGEMAAREGERLFWVLGIDMAHMGRRYHDPFTAHAEKNRMIDVRERDLGRIERVAAADADGFWERVRENEDDLKWCGSAPVYTFLKAVPQARGELLRYQQWNIDPESVVSFAAMRFATAC